MMVKHSFKIGDKVRLISSVHFYSLGTKALTIVGFENDTFVMVNYIGSGGSHFPLRPDEIEYVVKVGEQLLFSFFKEIRNG